MKASIRATSRNVISLALTNSSASNTCCTQNDTIPYSLNPVGLVPVVYNGRNLGKRWVLSME